MQTITYKGKEVTLLTHKEKAAEMGISTKTLTRWKKSGKISTSLMIQLPTWKNAFFFKEEQFERPTV